MPTYSRSASTSSAEAQRTTEYPRSRATSSTAWHRSAKKGLETSAMIRPTVRDAFPLRLRANSLGRYPSLSATSATRAAVTGLTIGSPFTTRETVLIETPASRPTSANVTRLALPLSAPPAKVPTTLSSCEPPRHWSGGARPHREAPGLVRVGYPKPDISSRPSRARRGSWISA